MITNFWQNTHFFCMNHDKPVPMVVMQGETPFYACPKYMRKDEEHPDGREEGEPMCTNRLSFTMATNIVDKMMSIVEEDMKSGVIAADYKNLTFTVSGIDVKILKYSLEDGIKYGILNRRAVNP